LNQTEFHDVLLVEDNPGDVRLVREALQEAGSMARLHVCQNGEEALAFLLREGEHTTAPRPDLIIMDLAMPPMCGKDLLRHLKQDPKLKTIPVVVFTSSTSEIDVSESYELHANCYVTKPLDFAEYLETIATIQRFWFGIVRLPTG
jgi:CheY-like chemotaxis protein